MKYIHGEVVETVDLCAMRVNGYVHMTMMDTAHAVDYDDLHGMVNFRCMIGNEIWEHL